MFVTVLVASCFMEAVDASFLSINGNWPEIIVCTLFMEAMSPRVSGWRRNPASRYETGSQICSGAASTTYPLAVPTVIDMNVLLTAMHRRTDRASTSSCCHNFLRW